ncbi:MAG: YfhO family protein, partial [Bacteroidetes bacterium]|jgi:hypothetical protein|nr:YfhO family protein [Bacteroidota bacterium]
MLGLWWVVEGVGAVRNDRWKPFLRTTGWLALGSLLALAMVAQPYLSVAEYKDFSIRGAASGGAAGEGALAWDYAMGWSQGVGELVTLLIADAYGGGQAYWGPKPFTAGPHYVGGVVLLLAILALWRLRTNVVWALGLGTVLMMLFSLGEHFELLNRPMFEFFPLFDAFRVPETWLSIAALALALLAAFGVYYLARPEPTDEASATKTKHIYIVSGGMVGLVLLLIVFRGALFDFEKPGEYQQVVQQVAASNDVAPNDPRVARAAEQYLAQMESDRKARFSDDAQRTLIFLIFAAAVLSAYRREWIPGWTMQVLLALLVVVDLWGVDRRYFSEDDLRRAQDPDDLIAKYDFDQFLLERQAEAGGPGAFRVLSLESGNPMVNARPSFYHESIGGYHGAKLRLFQDYIDHVFMTDRGLPSENALDLLNVRYIIARGVLPETEPVFQSEQTRQVVLRNPDAVPRAFLVGDAEVVASPDAMWDRLQSSDFDPRATALLSEAIDFDPAPLDSMSRADVTLDAYGPREIRWTVSTDAPRLLVASEVYYPAGWNAYVDGEPSPIYRANYLLRAVPIPAGEHEVVMRFEPTSYRRGLWISGIATALTYGGVLVLVGLHWWRREDEEAPADEGADDEQEA